MPSRLGTDKALVKSGQTSGARIAAIVGIGAVIAVGGYLFLNSTSPGDDSKAAATTTRARTTTSTASTATKTTGTTKAAQTTKTTETKQTTTSTGPEKKPPNKSKPPTEGTNALDAALARYPIVVVSVYAKGVPVSMSARAEAEAGAGLAHVGFVAVNVYDEKQALQLSTTLEEKLDSSSAPALLIYQRGRKLAFSRLGFVDRYIVAQAAESVGPAVPVWNKQANAICARYRQDYYRAFGYLDSMDPSQLTTAQKKTTALDLLSQAATFLRKFSTSLGQVRPPADIAQDYQRLVSDISAYATVLDELVSAIKKSSLSELKTSLEKGIALEKEIESLAAKLRLPRCSDE
jgi:hypothetical protein